MTRQEFSDKLRAFRDENGVKLKDITYALGGTESGMYRIEKATHSYNIQKAITYANACKAQICVTFPDNTQEIIETPQEIAKILEIERGKQPIAVVAANTDYTPQAIKFMETGKTTLSIDMLLALADYYALKIDVIPKE